MKKIAIFVLACAALAVSAVASAQEAQKAAQPAEQAVVMAPKGFYAGVVVGPSFGVATFRSISDRAAAVGIKGGIELGYRFSPFFSVSLDAAYGTVPTKAMSCCNYWLREGERYSNTAAPASNAWHYYDLTSKASLLQVVLQPNFNIVALFDKAGESRWAVDLSPRIGCARTVATLGGYQASGKYHREAQDPQMHLDYGGQIQCAYALSSKLEAALYASIDFLGGERFDCIPEWVHTENFLWDGGVKLIWLF